MVEMSTKCVDRGETGCKCHIPNSFLRCPLTNYWNSVESHIMRPHHFFADVRLASQALDEAAKRTVLPVREHASWWNALGQVLEAQVALGVSDPWESTSPHLYLV